MNKSTKLYDFCVLELFNSLLSTTLAEKVVFLYLTKWNTQLMCSSLLQHRFLRPKTLVDYSDNKRDVCQASECLTKLGLLARHGTEKVSLTSGAYVLRIQAYVRAKWRYFEHILW